MSDQDLQAQLDEALAQVEAERREVLALQHQLRETQALLEGERERMLAETAEGARELALMVEERDQALRELKKAKARPSSTAKRTTPSGQLRRVARKLHRMTGGRSTRVLRKARAIVRQGRGTKAGA